MISFLFSFITKLKTKWLPCTHLDNQHFLNNWLTLFQCEYLIYPDVYLMQPHLRFICGKTCKFLYKPASYMHFNRIWIFTSVACAFGTSVTMSSTDFSFQNLVFKNLFGIFSGKNHLKNQYLPHSESKSYQIIPLNPAHQDLSNNTKGTFQFLQNFQWKNH